MNKKVIIITGTSSGIGKCTAEFLVNKGYVVYGLARSKGDANINYICCDVTKKEEILSAVEEVYAKEKQIDILINNAGMGVSGAIELASCEELDKIINVNLKGAIMMMQACIPYLRNTKGKIINIGSVAGELAIPFQAYYSATKSALMMVSEALRMELKPFHIAVTVVLPGDTKTSFTKNRKQPREIINPLYQERINRSIKKMEHDEQNGKDPLSVSKVIYKVMKRKNPPIKVTVGFTYKLLVFLKRILPTRLVDYILYKMYAK